MWTREYWRGLAERAVKSGGQAAVLLWTGDGVFNVVDADWRLTAGVVAGAALLSAATSLASARIAERGTTSAIRDTA
ncbi:MAG TPA: holin [Streptosporangiaceae bacterium]